MSDSNESRVRFTLFTDMSRTDPKTTSIFLHSVEVFGGVSAGIYGFALEHQNLTHYKHLITLPVTAGIIKAMKTRGQICRGIVTLPPEIEKQYFDDDGNVFF